MATFLLIVSVLLLRTGMEPDTIWKNIHRKNLDYNPVNRASCRSDNDPDG